MLTTILKPMSRQEAINNRADTLIARLRWAHQDINHGKITHARLALRDARKMLNLLSDADISTLDWSRMQQISMGFRKVENGIRYFGE